jgi:F-type H+-transporting ATPase subunit b
MAKQAAPIATTQTDPHAGHDMAAAPVSKVEEADKALDMLENDAVPATHASTEVQSTEEHAVPNFKGVDATMLVAFAMLVVIGIAIWKKVPAMIAGMLDKQIVGIKAQLDQATALRAEAEAIKAEYEAKAKAAAQDAIDMKAAAVEEAKLIVSQAKTDATNLIARRAQAAEDKIAAAERTAVADVRAKAAAVSAAAAEQLIAAHHDANADASLVDQSISSLN